MTSINIYRCITAKAIPSHFYLENWLDMISSENQYSDLINDARKAGRKSDLYEKIKKHQLPCVTLNFTYENRKIDENIIDSTGFIFIEVDLLSKEEAIQYKENLKSNPHVYAAWLSLSELGVHFLIRSKVCVNSFESTIDTFVTKFNLSYDNGAKKKSQYVVLSYDKDLYINNNAIEFKKGTLVEHSKPNQVYINVPFLNCENKEYVKLRTEVLLDEYNEDCVFIPEGKLYFKLFIPFNVKTGIYEKISDGKRNTIMSSVIHTLILLNPQASIEHIMVFIKAYNRGHCVNPMNLMELTSIVNYKYSIRETLQPNMKFTKMKKYWVNPEVKDKKLAYTTKRSGNSDFSIDEFFSDELCNLDYKVTQQTVADYCKLSVKTIKRKLTIEHKEFIKKHNNEIKSKKGH